MQTVISSVFMFSGALTAYGYASGRSDYFVGGLMLSAVLLLMAIVEDAQSHEKKVNE